MATDLAGLGEVLPLDLEGSAETKFQECARYYEPMDFVLYLREDLPYRADRVDSFLTLLWHPHEDRAIGVKLKGFRYLFQRLQAIFRAQGATISDNEFLPLISAVEIAMVAGLGASMTAGEERKRLTKSYAMARSLVKSVRV